MRWTYCGLSLLTAVSVLWACSSSDDGSKVGDTPATGGSISVGGKASGVAGSKSSGSGGSTSSAGDGSGATAGEAPAPSCEKLEGLGECGTTSLLAKPKPINIMIVIDKSGSMTDQIGALTKWDAVKSALSTALGKAQPTLSFGLIMYPYNATNPIPLACDKNCCDFASGAEAVNVAVEPASGAVPKINAALQGTAPGGGTPTAAALSRALEYYTSGAGAALEGEKYVLLATDGGPNCNAGITCGAATCTTNLDKQCTKAGGASCCDGADASARCLDDAATKGKITELNTAGIKTFVVGIPGTETYEQYLNDFAVAGGVPNTEGAYKYFRVDQSSGVEGLTKVFTTITENLIRSCDVDMTQVPPEPDKVNIAINCEVLPKEGGAAWDFDTTNNQLIKIKGSTCDFITTKGVQRIDVVFGCPTISIR